MMRWLLKQWHRFTTASEAERVRLQAESDARIDAMLAEHEVKLETLNYQHGMPFGWRRAGYVRPTRESLK